VEVSTPLYIHTDRHTSSSYIVATYRVVVDWGGDMEDPVASAEGGTEAVAVQEIGAPQG
jgi:hypothetical protein